MSTGLRDVSGGVGELFFLVFPDLVWGRLLLPEGSRDAAVYGVVLETEASY